MSFAPRLTITNPITAALTAIERARGFLEAHHTTHIRGTHSAIYIVLRNAAVLK